MRFPEQRLSVACLCNLSTARPELDTTYAVVVKDGALFLRGRRLGGALTPSVRDEFTLGSMVVRFVRDAQGQPSAFLLGQGRVRNLKFARSEAP